MRRATDSFPRLSAGHAGAALTLAMLALLVGCASSPEPEPDLRAAADGDSTSAESPLCRRNATVTVRVDNRSTFDLRIRFGTYRPAKVSLGFSRSSYQIARSLLKGSVGLEIVRGGTQVGPPAVIPMEPVFCNIATLVIGSRPEYSIFYGDELREPRKGRNEAEEPAAEEPPAEEAPEPAPADSTSGQTSG